MPHDVTFKIIDSRLHLRPEAATALPAAVSAALLALEELRPGTLESTTPAASLDEALAAVGWELAWDAPDLVRLVLGEWLSVSLAGLLVWADIVRPFLVPGSFVLLAIGDGTTALLLDEGHEDRPLAGTELETLISALDALGRHGAICGRPPAWEFDRAARSIARVKTPLRAAERLELYTCIHAWDRAWRPSILLCGGMMRWPLEWRWRGDLALFLTELRATGLLVRHNGQTSGSIWLVPHGAFTRLQELQEERTEL